MGTSSVRCNEIGRFEIGWFESMDRGERRTFLATCRRLRGKTASKALSIGQFLGVDGWSGCRVSLAFEELSKVGFATDLSEALRPLVDDSCLHA